METRAPAPVLTLPNQRWSLDFVHDQMTSGRRFRVLNIVDDAARECLAAVPHTSISGRRVVRELASTHAYGLVIKSMVCKRRDCGVRMPSFLIGLRLSL